ncbi:sensor histidine kinase [Catenulispora rubra]|uniref:sensor histidine kinase n=1 Tax=Catenulispora rubra TaxID=280293 RepID=UPI0018927DBC|nr:histidine kinase [Catenulispora rubra]
MLRTTQWLLRAVAVVVIGVETLAFGRDRSAAADTATATALAVSCIALALWALLEARGELQARGGTVLALLLTVIAVAAGTVSTQHGSSMIGVVLVAVVAAGTQTELATSWYIASAAAVAVAGGGLAIGTGTGSVLGYLLIVLVSVLAGHQRRSYRVQAEQSALLLQQVEQLRAEQRRVAVLDERARIAREIHDVLAHSLGALGIQIQAARALLEDHDCGDGDGDGSVERADEVLSVAQRMAGDGLTETRRAVNALRTDTASLDRQLATMAQEHRRLHGSAVRLRIDGDDAPLQSEQALAVARAAQESLTNAAKHAPHQEIQIVVRYEEDAVTLTVANALAPDGADASPAGFATAGFATVNGGYGLTGMRERLLLLGGTLTAGIDDGRWTVVAKVPR